MGRRYPAIALFGPPGTGKGTQGKILGAVPGYHYFGMGEVFRALPAGSDLHREADRHMKSGELVPADIVLAVWRGEIERRIEDGSFRPESEVLLLDGVPRTIPQAQALAPEIDYWKVLHLAADDETELLERIRERARRGGRSDEAETLVRHRFEVYRNQTAPVLQWFPSERVARIAAERPPLEVLRQIVDALLDGGTS